MERKLKVRYLDGNSKHIGIKLQGKWLETAGFMKDDLVLVTVEKDRIEIKKTPTK